MAVDRKSRSQLIINLPNEYLEDIRNAPKDNSSIKKGRAAPLHRTFISRGDIAHGPTIYAYDSSVMSVLAGDLHKQANFGCRSHALFTIIDHYNLIVKQ